MFHNNRGTRLDFLPLFASNEKYAQNLKLKNNKQHERFQLLRTNGSGVRVWCPVDATHTACRFVTSWATTEAEITELEKSIPTKN